jgi:hypothetical protein
MNVIKFRMSEGAVEKSEGGKKSPSTVEAVRASFGSTVAYLLEREGTVTITDDPEGQIKRAISVP